MAALDGDYNVCFSSLISRVWALLTERRISARSKSRLSSVCTSFHPHVQSSLLSNLMSGKHQK